VSKRALDLANRNRTAECVNAMAGVEDPQGFMLITRQVARGRLPPEALAAVLNEEAAFTVKGTREGEDLVLDPLTLSEARERAWVFNTGGVLAEVVYIPTGTVIGGPE